MNVRSRNNRNLTITTNSHHRGLEVITSRGPLIVEYLDATREVMEEALSDYARVFAFRVDLRVPASYECELDTNVITRFISSLKAKITADYYKKKRKNGRCHPCALRYVRVKEQRSGQTAHYHVALFLNNDRFCAVGNYGADSENLASRIKEAWASALGIDKEDVGGSVHFPKNSWYLLDRVSGAQGSEFGKAFYRLSYLAKEDTKGFGDGSKWFGRSHG